MTSAILALALRARENIQGAAAGNGRRTLSYTQLHDSVCRVADYLKTAQVSTLALAADNSVDWLVVDLAAQHCGVTLVPVPSFFSREQIAHALEDSGADGIAMDALGRSLLGDVGSELMGTLTDTLTLHRLRRARNARLDSSSGPHAAKISYTSGTTGQPKGVRLSQSSMDRVGASLAAATAGIGIRRHLCLLPLATLLENVAGLYAPLLQGVEIVIPSLRETGLLGATGIDADRLVSCISEHAAESVIFVPQMLEALIRACETGATRPPALKFIAVGGGKVADSLLERADAIGLPVFEGYGMTECASVVALNTPAARRRGSVGRALAHVDIREGAGGELVVRGNGMIGYTGDAAAATTEWHTGDIGSVDKDGYVYVTGRKKNVFITSFGRNVSPEWVEACLTAEPAVLQAAVFGEARPWNVGIVFAHPGTETQAIEQAVQRANRHLPDYARIGQWLRAEAPFTPQNGLATANGRNRRDAIFARYRVDVDACYAAPLGHCA